MDQAMAHSFGRIEGKLDRVDDKLDAQGQLLATHGVRLDHVENRVDDLEAKNSTEDRAGISFRQGLALVACSVLGSGAVGLVNAFINSR